MSWVENADNCVAFRCDNVSIHAVALQGPGGGGERCRLRRCSTARFRFANPRLAGRRRRLGRGAPDGPVDFDVTFYSVPTCSFGRPSLASRGADDLETNDRGIGAFAIDGLPRRPGRDARRCDASRTDPRKSRTVSMRTATTVLADGVSTTAVQWRTTGLPAHHRPGALVQGADRPEQPRDVRLQPAGRLRPRRLQGHPGRSTRSSSAGPSPRRARSRDRRSQQAGRRHAGRPLQHVAVQPVVLGSDELEAGRSNPDVFSPQFSPTEYSPTEYSASLTRTDRVLTDRVLTHRILTDRSTHPRNIHRPSTRRQFSRDDWASFNPADPRAFSAAQTASLVAVSPGPGTGDETVAVNTWNNTGNFYVRVQGKNGSFDPERAFTIQADPTGQPLLGGRRDPRRPHRRRRAASRR